MTPCYVCGRPAAVVSQDVLDGHTELEREVQCPAPPLGCGYLYRHAYGGYEEWYGGLCLLWSYLERTESEALRNVVEALAGLALRHQAGLVADSAERAWAEVVLASPLGREVLNGAAGPEPFHDYLPTGVAVGYGAALPPAEVLAAYADWAEEAGRPARAVARYLHLLGGR